MSAAKDRGTRWESAIVDWLRANGAPHAERRAANGNRDRGDIAGLPGVVIEAKNEKAMALAAWLAEAETGRRNDNHAPVAVVWHKRRGKASPGDAYVTMTGHQFLGLLRAAGYVDEDSAPAAETQTPAAGAAGGQP